MDKILDLITVCIWIINACLFSSACRWVIESAVYKYRDFNICECVACDECGKFEGEQHAEECLFGGLVY